MLFRKKLIPLFDDYTTKSGHDEDVKSETIKKVVNLEKKEIETIVKKEKSFLELTGGYQSCVSKLLDNLRWFLPIVILFKKNLILYNILK